LGDLTTKSARVTSKKIRIGELAAPFDGLRAIGTWFDDLTTGAVRKKRFPNDRSGFETRPLGFVVICVKTTMWTAEIVEKHGS
jgi:hypothetical protein